MRPSLPAVVPLDFPVGHPVWAGHFPDRPVLPGALLLDALLLALGAGDQAGWQVVAAKFPAPALPGAPLLARLAAPDARGDIACTIDADGRTVAIATLRVPAGA